MARWATLAVAIPLLAATDPRAKPEDYERHGEAGIVRLGADFHGRGVPGPDGGVLLKNYVVVEVAVFPATRESLRVSSSLFRLQVDRRQPILAASPGEVGMDLRLGGLEDGGFTGTAQAGPAVIAIDRPRAERFPGDPLPGGRPRVPTPPRAPEDATRTGPKIEVSGPELVTQAALEEGEATGPRAGFIYFRWKEKLTRAKSIVLIYEGPGGKITLPLKQAGGK